MSYIDNLPYDIHELHDGGKIEHVLLVSLTGWDPTPVENLSFVDPVYEQLAHIWLPNIYQESPTYVTGMSSAMFEGPFVDFWPNSPTYAHNENVLVSGHAVMFDTNFGRRQLNDSWYTSQVPLIYSVLAGEMDPNWVGEHLIALQLLGETLPQDRYQEVNAWHANTELTRNLYHPHIVVELLNAIVALG